MTMGETWKRETKGALELRLYAGGKAGGEAEMVGLMMADSLQASLLTAVGLAEIDPSSKVLQSLPMAFHNLDEVDYVGEKLQPLLEQLLDRKGFVVLFWSDVGWVRFYSNKPVVVPDDLRKLRLFTWAGDTEQLEIVKSAGFNLVPIETADIVPSLQTGLIDAVPVPSFYAMAGQVDRRAPYMLALNYAPLVGACVINKTTWQAIPAEMRPAVLAAARLAGREIKAAGRRESVEAEAAMVKRGLKITQPSPEVVDEWRKMAEAQYPKIRGGMIPVDVFDKAMASLKEYRSRGNP
jgi:TRAP-type C4-dicarboxylate transport system substrate-binding protein